jgi:hypothetical protein
MTPSVQQELDLTSKQKEKLKRLDATVKQTRRQVFEDNDGASNPEATKTTMDNLRRNHNAAIAKILDEKQNARLTELELQREGVLAVAKPDIAKKLNLRSEQSTQIKAILDEMREALARAMPRPPGGRRRGGNGAGGGPPGDGPPGAGGPPGEGADDEGRAGGGFPAGGPPPRGGDNGDDNGPPGGGPFGGGQFGGGPGGDGGPPGGGPPNFNNAEFRAQFAKIREATEKARTTATKAINEVLTKDQKADFDKMLGKPFDFSTIGPDPGGPPQQGTAKNRARTKGRRKSAR